MDFKNETHKKIIHTTRRFFERVQLAGVKVDKNTQLSGWHEIVNRRIVANCDAQLKSRLYQFFCSPHPHMKIVHTKI